MLQLVERRCRVLTTYHTIGSISTRIWITLIHLSFTDVPGEPRPTYTCVATVVVLEVARKGIVCSTTPTAGFPVPTPTLAYCLLDFLNPSLLLFLPPFLLSSFLPPFLNLSLHDGGSTQYLECVSHLHRRFRHFGMAVCGNTHQYQSGKCLQ